MSSVRTGLLGAVGAALFLSAVGLTQAQGAPLIRGQNYVEDKFKVCNTASCELNFTPIPAGKYLVVTNISCVTQTRNAANIPEISFHGNTPFNLMVLIPVFAGNRVAGGQTIREYFANNQVFALVTAAIAPRIRITTFSQQGFVSTLECTIGGQLKPN